MPSASRRRASLPTYMSGHPSGYLATSEFAIHSSSNFEVPPAAPERTSAGAGSRAPLLAALQQRSNLNNSAPGCCDYRPGLAAAEKACGGSTSGPRHVSGPGLAPQQRSPGATMQPDPGDHTGFAVHRTASMPVGAASYSSMRLNLRAAVPGVSITSKAALATDLVRALSHARRGSQDGDQNRLAGSRGGPANVMVIS
ncbi:hypothetical protein HYH03_002608 [Edaphochlamys debaryana]|uniref:Uncharacterized protein n=1 Tax=Edaphochlamys debaryana TaxID=47281 RepID=A0A835YEB9_9CHLO|nr:hypothetical protein HYH03_002608 [Edaphochlamys debaryana]|eukprot:KAG2499673.1 hypothetical protein HYH03_002608 [Edaphochlamys debaryana]